MSRQFFVKPRQLLSLTWMGWLIALLLVGCDRSPQTAAEIRIGLIAPFNGKAEETTGKPTVNGAELAIAELKKTGGLKINGEEQKIVLIIKDNRDNPDEAVAVATELINQEKVVAIVGVPRSRSAIPVANITERSGIPLISSTSTHPDTTANKKYAFRLAYTNEIEAQVIASFASKNLGIKKAAVLYDIASDYNRNFAETFKEKFEALKGEIVAYEAYTTDLQTFTSQLETIRESQAELVFLPNYAEEVVKQAREIKNMGLEVKLIGGDSWGAIGEENYSYLEGGFFAEVWTEDIPNAATKDFVELYTRVYGEKPNANAALTYDSINLIAEAIKNKNKAAPESIRNGLAEITNYEGVSGNISYQNSGDPVKGVILLKIENGQRVFYEQVEP